jgi:hypothetical protein
LGIAAEIASQFPTWGRKFQVNYVEEMNKQNSIKNKNRYSIPELGVGNFR